MLLMNFFENTQVKLQNQSLPHLKICKQAIINKIMSMKEQGTLIMTVMKTYQLLDKTKNIIIIELELFGY